MIRPRCGDFVYSDSEIEVMLEDIKAFKQQSVQGIVAGILTSDGKVALDSMKKFAGDGYFLCANSVQDR